MNLDTGQELMYNSLGLDGLFFLYILLSTYYSSLPNNGMNRNRKKKELFHHCRFTSLESTRRPTFSRESVLLSVQGNETYTVFFLNTPTKVSTAGPLKKTRASASTSFGKVSIIFCPKSFAYFSRIILNW